MGQDRGSVEARTLLWPETVDSASHPLWTTYARGRTADQARRALQRADELVRQAELARLVVRAQAAFALQDAGMTVRDIAATLDVSKSTVGRELRSGHHSYIPPAADTDPVMAAITAAWEDDEPGR